MKAVQAIILTMLTLPNLAMARSFECEVFSNASGTDFGSVMIGGTDSGRVRFVRVNNGLYDSESIYNPIVNFDLTPDRPHPPVVLTTKDKRFQFTTQVEVRTTSARYSERKLFASLKMKVYGDLTKTDSSGNSGQNDRAVVYQSSSNVVLPESIDSFELEASNSTLDIHDRAGIAVMKCRPGTREIK